MTAAVSPGIQQGFEIEEVDLAPPRAGEVLVRVVAAGLCASDLNALDGKRTIVPFPAVLGHEAAGVVAETGPGVTRLQPGDHVVMSIVPWCGSCRPCRRGLPNHCEVVAAQASAGNLLDGSRRLSCGSRELSHFLMVSAFAEYAVVPESGVVAVDPAIPLDRAALLSCAVLTGYGAVHNSARVRPGESVAVFGCGGVGLNIVQGARMAGATPIIAVDVHPDKLDLARVLGATHVLDATADDPVSAIRDLTVGGVDYAFEAAGRQETFRQAWMALGVGGELVSVGLLRSGELIPLDSGPLVAERRIRGCYYGG
ncbi:MAG: alcohol dehydrogenase catalytic domain-containing protein, partial [Chloroflexi bacterium]|nr:alcohol dehydrogenase catalytic domain-containing protein [Chloroflexota bacterium]